MIDPVRPSEAFYIKRRLLCDIRFNRYKPFWLFCLCAGFGTLRAVLGARLHSSRNALCIEGSSYDVVTHTGEVLNTAAANENNTVFLKIVTYAGNVRRYFDSV